MASESTWVPVTQPEPSAVSRHQYPAADPAARDFRSMLVAAPPSHSQLRGPPHLDAPPRTPSLPPSHQPASYASWRDPHALAWPQYSHAPSGKRPATPPADPGSPAKRQRMSSHPPPEANAHAAEPSHGRPSRLPPRSSGEFQHGGHQSPMPWPGHAHARELHGQDWQRRAHTPAGTPATQHSRAAGPGPQQEPQRERSPALAPAVAPSRDLDANVQRSASPQPFEMRAQKPSTAWSEAVPTRVAHRITNSFKVYSNAFMEGRVPGHDPMQHIVLDAAPEAREEAEEAAASKPLPNVSLPLSQRSERMHADSAAWPRASNEPRSPDALPPVHSAAVSHFSRTSPQEWQRQQLRRSPPRAPHVRTPEWGGRGREHLPAQASSRSAVPDFEQWMADSQQQHMAEHTSLGAQGSTSDLIQVAQALQAQVEQQNPDLNSAQRDLLQQLMDSALAPAPSMHSPQPKRADASPAETTGPPSLIRTGGMLGAPRGGASTSSGAGARVSSSSMNILRQPQPRPPTHQRIIVHGHGQGVGTGSDEAAQKAAREFSTEHEAHAARRARFGPDTELGWGQEQSLASMASSEMTAFPPLARPGPGHQIYPMQSSVRPSQPAHSTPPAPDMQGPKAEHGGPEPEGGAEQKLIPVVQQASAVEGVVAAAAAANDLATAAAALGLKPPVSVRGADDRMAAETLISLTSMGGEPSVATTSTAMVAPAPRQPPVKAPSASPPARPPSAQRARVPKRVIEGMHPILGIAVPHARRTSMQAPPAPGATAAVTGPTPAVQPAGAEEPAEVLLHAPAVVKPPAAAVASPSVSQSTEDDLPPGAVGAQQRSLSTASERDSGRQQVSSKSGKANSSSRGDQAQSRHASPTKKGSPV